MKFSKDTQRQKTPVSDRLEPGCLEGSSAEEAWEVLVDSELSLSQQ